MGYLSITIIIITTLHFPLSIRSSTVLVYPHQTSSVQIEPYYSELNLRVNSSMLSSGRKYSCSFDFQLLPTLQNSSIFFLPSVTELIIFNRHLFNLVSARLFQSSSRTLMTLQKVMLAIQLPPGHQTLTLCPHSLYQLKGCQLILQTYCYLIQSIFLAFDADPKSFVSLQFRH